MTRDEFDSWDDIEESPLDLDESYDNSYDDSYEDFYDDYEDDISDYTIDGHED